MTLDEMAEELQLTNLAAPRDGGREVTGGYASDLLSCVMARAGAGNVWITLQTHPNIVAVASLLDLACIIVSESPRREHVDQATIEKAQEEGVALYASPLTTYSIVARLARAGLSGNDA